MDKETGDKTSSIDRAIAAAQARKNAKAANAAGTAPSSDGEVAKAEKKPKKTDEERKAEEAKKEADRLARKQERDEARAKRKADKETQKKTPHMSKVDKAAARLPRLDDTAQRVFNETVVNLTRDQIAALQAHLQHFNRVKATESSLAQKLAVGDSVKIVGGETKYTGREGTVLKVQRIRCYVEVEGASKPVYLFTSDVERFEAESPSIAKAS